MNVSVILPSYKPDDKLLLTVLGLEAAGFDDIIVVDDGGGKKYKHFFEDLEGRESCTVLTHPENRGKGAAMKTAFAWYLENRRNGSGVITVDGDGQHSPKDVLACAIEMEKTGRIVLGVRDFDEADIPGRSRFGNKCTSMVFRIFVGLKISDTQTGLRAIPINHLETMLYVEGDRYEYETNQLLCIKKEKLKFKEVKIETVYINENETSHFRPVRDSVKIYSLIIKYLFRSKFMKFLGSSCICYVIDWVLFTVLHFWLIGVFGETSALATAIPIVSARLISSLVNFFINRSIFDNGGGSLVVSILKYYALAAFILAAGTVSLHFASLWLREVEWVANNISDAWLQPIIKFPIDCFLYVISYSVQKIFVFKRDKKVG